MTAQVPGVTLAEIREVADKAVVVATMAVSRPKAPGVVPAAAMNRAAAAVADPEDPGKAVVVPVAAGAAAAVVRAVPSARCPTSTR
jgi:hypothetical protein